MLKITTAGESHGEFLIGILENMPSGVEINIENLEKSLLRRKGCGRSERQKKESEEFKILSGVRNNITTGNPIAVKIINQARDVSEDFPVISRPGHADLIGSLKYEKKDARDAIERASARETAMRTLLSQIAAEILKPFKVKAVSFVKQLGEIKCDKDYYDGLNEESLHFAYNSPMGAINPEIGKLYKKEIENSKKKGDTIGGIIEVIIKNPPIGIGSFVSSENKADAQISKAIMSLQSVKGIIFGRNIFEENISGRNYQDSPYIEKKGIKHTSNNQGGFEAGMTNGEDIVIDIALKPIPTLISTLPSINILTGEKKDAGYERSDITQLTSAGVILESIVLFEVARIFSEEIGGDTMNEMIERYNIHKRKFEYD